MYLFSVLEFIVGPMIHHNCDYDSCDISECHQINEDSDLIAPMPKALDVTNNQSIKIYIVSP